MDSPAPLAELRGAQPAILPSLLLCDFGDLKGEFARLEAAGVPGMHLDVMDGHFVPNFTYGLTLVEAARRLTKLPLDVHLMMREPERYVDRFRAAGADVLTIHVEAVADPRPVLAQIRASGAAAGLALNPGTPLASVEKCLDLCHLVLVMSVEAGFGGQKFNPIALEKLNRLRAMKIPGLALEIDGGVNAGTIRSAAEAGAGLFVVGSAIFGQPDYAAAVRQLRQLAILN
jgi:ribulose-phosphate 3-epimerase